MLSVTGLVDKPTRFTMADLVTKFDQVTVSATLVCVGNRRKEQNLVKKTKGFSWGASAVGTGEHHHTRSAQLVLRMRQCHPLQAGALGSPIVIADFLFFLSLSPLPWLTDHHKLCVLWALQIWYHSACSALPPPQYC